MPLNETNKGHTFEIASDLSNLGKVVNEVNVHINELNVVNKDTAVKIVELYDAHNPTIDSIKNEKTSQLGAVNEGKKFQCDKCNYESNLNNNVQQHNLSVHEGVKYQCNSCDDEFSTPSQRLKHIKSFHMGLRFNCSQCDFKGFSSNTLR